MKILKTIRPVLWATAALLAVTSSAWAGVVKPNATYFKTVGTPTWFQFAPASYSDATHPNSFFYDVYYYIPNSLRNATNVKAVIFNHGGGGSTMTRQGSMSTVNMYASDLKRMADELGIVVVLPSANGLNWGGHTVGLMRELAKMLRAELEVDANRIGMSGHSMGGMGIGRAFNLLADTFSFFMPIAAGMDLDYAPAAQTEWQINKVFNVPYIHIQGLNDHFEVFVTRCRELVRRTQELETRYGIRSKLNMVFTNDSHNYNYDTFKQHLNQAFQAPRDLYQPRLFGTVVTGSTWNVENNITFRWTPSARYFWIEAVNADLSVAEGINFYAKIENNVVTIDLPVIPKQTKTLRVYLSSKMANLSQPIDVVINGRKVATRAPAPGSLQSIDPTDTAVQYEGWIDAPIPQ